ncbi:MAG: carbohydrate ABC transporter permease [Rhizobiales bacterium]|nr:carbohydrate ABC transporter permease [Hyphomicrobiales bacterium]
MNTTRSKVFAYLWLGLCVLVFMAPIAWMVLQSLKGPIDAIAVPPKFLFTPTLDNYVAVLGSRGFQEAFLGSLVVAVSSVGIGLVLGVPFAYALARLPVPGNEEISHFILSTKMLPAIVVIAPLVQVYRQLGILDTHVGLILAHILIVLVDGIPLPRTFVSIILPIAVPGLVTVAALSFILSWNDLFFALTLTSSRVKTLPLFMGTEYVGFLAVDWGKLSAAGLLAIAPIVVLVLVLQRYLVRGLAMGAVK